MPALVVVKGLLSLLKGFRLELNLHQRTIIILGQVGSTSQSLLSTFAAQGADVILLGPEANKLQKFCQSISDLREVNSKNGRAGCVNLDSFDKEAIKDAIGKASQTFGGLDIFIDAMMDNRPSPFRVGEENNSFEVLVERNLLLALRATEYVSGFFKSRKKGRIIYLLNDAMNRNLPTDAVGSATRTGLIAFAKTLAKQMQEFHVTVNCVSLGLTEEYLQGHFPESASLKQSAELMKSFDPSFKLTEPEKIANALLFLSSPMGSSITGQHLILS